MWELSGIPCVHACAAMNYTHQHPDEYISDWFSKNKFVETYKGNIRPLNGSSMWAKTPYTKPLPPMARRMPGRPKTKRRKHATEDDSGYKRVRASGGSIICRNCWEQGHNKRTCKNQTKPPPPKDNKKIGRPLKTSQHETGIQPMPSRSGPNIGRPLKTSQHETCKNQTKPAPQNEKLHEGIAATQDVQVNEKLDEGTAARQEATGPTIEVGDDGLQEVDVVQTFKGHATAKYLIESGYKMAEVVNVLMETPLPLTVEQLTQCDEEVHVVAETQQEEFIEETQPSKQKLKSRKKSERILNAKLSQIKGGPGSTSGNPYTLE